ncbi:hypothetical protein [Nitratidesulfovibrio vulgaris]|uniref:hypothetical protein n=1 Tax=Nitratidesulfovibrio vulgaris TaxID=881 RepID=UPI002300B94A|nr:hypothetical protein [Nitratidesulfovibrio vulgaris]WCB47062.1 hypothetical protein PH214_03000 [Nitratidesulfovibrio vulgaris]
MYQRALAILLILSFGAASGCSWVGRTAGKVQAKIERKTDAVEKGYNDGYSGERQKQQ